MGIFFWTGFAILTGMNKAEELSLIELGMKGLGINDQTQNLVGG